MPLKGVRALLVPFLIVTLLLPVMAQQANPKAAEETVLNATELQEALGITAWRVRIPASFGDRPELLFEHYIDGKRTAILETNLILREPETHREVLVALREEGKHYRVFHRHHGVSQTGRHPVKPDGMGDHDYAETQTVPETTERDVLLMRVRYYKQDPPQDNGEDSARKMAGEVLLRVAKNKEPRKESVR